MKKIGIITSVVALGAIGAYALVPALFPNTPAFPRVPVGSGTIGEMIGRLIGTNDLANYFGDGTVENTNFLSWVSATGYLQSITCPGSNIWKGIDANGKALCGPRVPMLTDYGRVSDQKCPATIYKTDGSTVMSSSGYILKWGDIVQTPVGCDLTIAFSDLSTLHLDEDTTVSLDMGTFPNNTTIATAILENGQIWGRILTETGVYNIGTRSIVAAVRGTSISLSMTGWINSNPPYDTNLKRWMLPFRWNPNGTRLTIIDSTMPIASAKLHCEAGTGIRDIYNTDMKPGDTYNLPSGFPSHCNTILQTLSTPDLYTENRWIARNTLKDLDYMSGALQNPNLPSPKSAKITNEYTLSFPTTPLEKNTICLPGEKFFPQTLGMTQKFDPCKTIAFADYIHGGGLVLHPLVTNSWVITDTLKPTPIPLWFIWDDGYLVNDSGEYLWYENTVALPFASLSWKVITISYTGTASAPNTLVYFWGWWYKRIRKTSTPNQFQCVGWNSCDPNTGLQTLTAVNGKVTFRAPSGPITYFWLWNNAEDIGSIKKWESPIWVTFKSISISN